MSAVRHPHRTATQRSSRRRGVLSLAAAAALVFAITPALEADAQDPPEAQQQPGLDQLESVESVDEAFGGVSRQTTPEEADRPALQRKVDKIAGIDTDQRLDKALDGMSKASRRALAQRTGKSVARLRELAQDSALHVGPSGVLYYVEPAIDDHDQGAGGAEPDATAEAAPPFPLNDTFLLHSRQGANRVVYLDFNGYNMPAGTAWLGGAPYNAPAMDTAGNGAGFTNAELELIQGVWERVAEDFRPFDVDVTTQYPGFNAIHRSNAADQNYGTRVVITDGDPVAAGFCGGCGGIAYIDVFDLANGNHSLYQPAWVFAGSLSQSEKPIAEAVTHEAGHNLNLLHDGTSVQNYYAGHTLWAPIMGVGYYRPVTQFSQGSYPDANQFQNDFAVMDASGLDYRPDEGTTSMRVRSRATGVISTSVDVDRFNLTSCGSPATITVNPAAVSPNLDVYAWLRDSSGALVAVSDPASAYVTSDTASNMHASLTLPANHGASYSLYVTGTGVGNWTNGYDSYGSRGAYTVNVSNQDGDCDAYAVLDKPNEAAYQAARWKNPGGGGAPAVTRQGTGRYRIVFPGMSLLGGAVNVTSMEPGTDCNVVSWGTNSANIRCWDHGGNAEDAPASVLWTYDRGDAFVWAHNQGAAQYTPSTTYSNNPSGGVTARRTAVGTYSVDFDNLDLGASNVQVTAYNNGPVFCRIGYWTSGGFTTTASVLCEDDNGNPADTRYVLTLTDGGDDGWFWTSGVNPGAPSAFWSNNPTAGGISLTRLGVGRWKATFDGMADGAGNVQVSAYGSTDGSCMVTSWSNDSSLIRCTDDTGAHVDRLFSLLHSAGPDLQCRGETITVDLRVGDTPTGGDDVIAGTAGDDTIDALGGHDTICAYGGDDEVHAGGGNDWVDAGLGGDRVLGQGGSDRIIGKAGNDILNGGNGVDRVYGSGDHDRLVGGGGPDQLRGGGGHDVLLGSAGNDNIHGNAGGDQMFGQGGTDTCNGGSGIDSAATCETVIGVP